MRAVHKKIKALFIVIAILITVFFAVNAYYMNHISHIAFPKGVKILKKQVSYSDVCGDHILSEELIETKLSHEEIRSIVNSSPYGKDIHVFAIGFDENRRSCYLDWDDYSIYLVKKLDGKNKDDMNYYLLNEATPYGQLIY